MNFRTGQMITVRNIVTKAQAAITIHDMAEYQGCYLVYGTRGPAPLWLPATRGHWVEKPGPVSFPFIPTASVEQLDQLITQLKGLPLVIDLGGGRSTPMINSNKQSGLWPHDPLRNQDDHMLKNRNIVDVWMRWQHTGDLKGAIRYAKANWRRGSRKVGAAAPAPGGGIVLPRGDTGSWPSSN